MRLCQGVDVRGYIIPYLKKMINLRIVPDMRVSLNVRVSRVVTFPKERGMVP